MLPEPAASQLRALQTDILEAVARGETLAAVADRLCRRAETMAPDVVCSILLVDEARRLRPLAAPSLPASFSAAIDGLPIGPSVGSCGTAAWRGEAVGVDDIATDPLWADYKGLALALGLRACWSSPITNRDGRCVGTFAFYYRAPRGPSDIDVAVVSTCVHLCAIAIEHEAALRRIHDLAFFDGLTGLMNRASFQARAPELLAAGPINVLYIDLDDFKTVNDTLGHGVGDQLLASVALRLSAAIGPGDFLARLGGDEFVIVQPVGNDGEGAARALAERIIGLVEEPLVIEERRVSVGVSIGIARSGRDGDDVSALARRADLALYRAKEAGRGTYRFFFAELETVLASRRELQQDLREALRRGELKVAYQPIVRLADGEITGFEALLRWQHPDRGAVSPGDFIPLAEEYGLIGSLGEWVLTEACREAQRWPKRLKLAVNLSPVQLRKPGFMLDVMRVLATTGTLPDRLELEVTETALLDRDSATRLALGELRSIGVSVALDDFGTGYSSLRYLQAFAFDRLKIDMSFVRDIEDKHDSTSIVRAVLQLARDLGVKTTAEGVETERQRAWLTAEGCTDAQGYLFARPLSAEDLTQLIAAPARRLDHAV